MHSKKPLVLVAALIAALAAGAAQARGNVEWSVSIGGPIGVSVYSAPQYWESPPAQVVVMPQPVYAQPSYTVYSSAPAYPVVPAYGGWRRGPVFVDRDRDGIPDRHDRVYNPRWDRDGDGIPNRYDRVDNRFDRHRGDQRPAPGWRDDRDHDGHRGR